MAIRKLHSDLSAGSAIAPIYRAAREGRGQYADTPALRRSNPNRLAGPAAVAVCATLLLLPDSGAANTQPSSAQNGVVAALPHGIADGSERIDPDEQAGSLRLTVQRGGSAGTRLRIDSGHEAMAMQTGENRQAASVSVAGMLEGVQVVASRTTGFEGRPIDIFRPIGTGAISTGALPSRLPVNARVSSGFGYRRHPTLGGWRAHSGVDLAAAYGSPVVATTGGVVEEADWRGGYGLLVGIRNGAVHTRYGHLSRLNVVAGQRVKPGDVIGYVGSTGRSTGPHLHYEVRVNGQAVDPMRAKAK